MGTKKVFVSSKNGQGSLSGVIVIRSKKMIREVKAVVFSNTEADILRSYIDKMTK